jgi:CubicO group peptidase (beta-lactamase class C family)
MTIKRSGAEEETIEMDSDNRHTPAQRRQARLSLLLVLTFWTVVCPAGPGVAQAAPPSTPGQTDADVVRRKEERQRFQAAELITARPFTFIFNPGDPPRIVWRDVDEVRRLGADGRLRVRWFDAERKEATTPNHPGRWGATIEGTAPNGTPLRRAMTFFCRPPGFLVYWQPDFSVPFPPIPGPIPREVWREHQTEVSRTCGDLCLRSLNDSEAGAILIAGLSEAKPLGRAPLRLESAAVRNDDHHLALKLKVQGLADKVRPLKPPRKRSAGRAPELRTGTAAEAGMHPEAKARIDAVCRKWAEDSGEPFVTLVARHGVIVTHEAFGNGKDGHAVGLDYRCDVASITKTVTAVLFSRFLDQGLIGLDDSVATVFPDYPKNSSHVPTFRQCLTHMSGLSGHGDWGGAANPHFENVVLNGIDLNEPGKAYAYSGMGFDLTAKAMEIVSGTSWRRLYAEQLFGPLGLGDVPMAYASAGAQFTARELGVFAQWLLNRGSYGEWEFIAPKTFERLLPEPLARRYPGMPGEEGIGMHWMRHLKPGAPAGSTRPEDSLFSNRLLGHGSLTSCILLADFEKDLVVAQVRRQAGPRFGDWAPQFFLAIVEGIAPSP